uniref:Internal scaffolding protein n=1 Tax=Dulem virus 215 TaxID=3145692 RepID=A0AAU8B373_9VIRU
MTKKCTFITQYSRTPESIRDTNVVEFKQPSKVKESLSYAVDINTIYESYCKTGKVPLNGNQPIYDEDFIKYDNLIEAQKAVSDACQYFQSLPPDIRNQYGNSLEKFVKAIHSNDQFLVDKGVLLKDPSTDLPAVQEPVTDTPVSKPTVEAPTTPTDTV